MWINEQQETGQFTRSVIGLPILQAFGVRAYV
jgi:hypothetical protein